jgi:hypothetical protein
MSSFAAHMSPAAIAAQVRMERQCHKGVFLLMEGASDAKRFSKFFDATTCSIINCYGKDNLVGAIELMQDVGHEDCIGFADADFDRILNTHVANDDIVHSQFHDFDIDICATDALNRYLCEMGDESKVARHGGHPGCVESILLGIKPLSAMRFANCKHTLGYRLTELELSDFYDGSTVDIDLMIDIVSRGAMSSSAHRAALRSHIDRYTASEFDLWQFTNGHDFIAALGIALRSRLGSRRDVHTWRSEVEKHLRLTFDVNDFRGLAISARIAEWEQGRTNLRVIRQVANS